MTTTEIAKKLNISKRTVLHRLEALKLNVNYRNYNYPDEVINLINYTKHQRYYNPRLSTKITFKILELYFFNNNNEVPEIAKALNISTSVANRVIDNYFKNKGLIVESKINEK